MPAKPTRTITITLVGPDANQALVELRATAEYDKLRVRIFTHVDPDPIRTEVRP